MIDNGGQKTREKRQPSVRLPRAALAVVAIGIAATLQGATRCCDLRYEIRPDPTDGVVDVVLTISGFRGDTLVVSRHSRRPLRGIEIDDPTIAGAGPGLPHVADAEMRWTFKRPADGWGEPIQVKYRLEITSYRPVNAWGVGLGHDLLYAPGEMLFLLPDLTPHAAMHAPVQVSWDLPRGWDVMTGWNGASFHGLRHLVRTNVLAGTLVWHRRAACGVSIELAAAGEAAFDAHDVADDVAAIACAARRRLGDPATHRFAISVVPARYPLTSGNRNGPHAVGIVHKLPDGSRPGPRLLAHELAHLWQQYEAPRWFQEGVNDYVALRLANEAGLLDDAQYGGALTTIETTYRAHPHRHDWSFSTEAQTAPAFRPSGEYLAYRKGALVGLALDRELRIRTAGAVDVTHLLREMNNQAARGHISWTAEEIADQAAALSDTSLERFFDRFVHGTDDVPRASVLLADLPPLPDPEAQPGPLTAVATFIQATLD